MTKEERSGLPLERDLGGSDASRREEGLRVQRAEEELGAGVRRRDAGAMNVRKSVRTEPEEVRVPRRREEVEVERVPVDREAPEGEIGEGEEVVV